MARIYRPPTPLEKRSRRLRFAYYTTFIAFLVGILLVVAWFAGSLTRRHAPFDILFASEPDATLTLHTRWVLEFGAANESEESLPAIAVLADSLGPQLKVSFWKNDDGQEAWVAWLPTTKRHRVFVGQIRRTVANIEGLLPVDAERTENHWGSFKLLPEGLLIFSDVEPPSYSLRPATKEPWGTIRARFRSDSEFLPWLLKKQLDQDFEEKGSPLLIEWTQSLEIITEDPDLQDVDLHPLGFSASEESPVE